LRLFYKYLKSFIKEDFNAGYYLLISIFIAVSIGINYSIDLEDSILDKLPTVLTRVLSFTVLYVFAYALVIFINKLFYPENNFLKNKVLWIKVLLGFTLLSFDTAIHISDLLHNIPNQLQYLFTKLANNLITLFTYIIPLWVIYKLIDKDDPSFYGLTSNGFQLGPYLRLFSVIIPIVVIASFIENFSSYYPTYKPNLAAEYFGIATWIPAVGYELAYGWNFVSVELLFRGFFVVGMVKILGRHAILPMVVAYCFIHFGKPIGECISSVAGGYLLGIIAYYSRSILGGIIIHIGLAWSMEVAAMLN